MHNPGDSPNADDRLARLARQFPGDFAAIIAQQKQRRMMSDRAQTRNRCGSEGFDARPRTMHLQGDYRAIVGQMGIAATMPADVQALLQKSFIPAAEASGAPAQPTIENCLINIADKVTVQVEERSARQVLIDPELGRLSTDRHEMSEFRLWAYGHAFTQSGAGRVAKAALLTHAIDLGLVASKRTFDDILARGAGLYWKVRQGVDTSGAPALYVHFTSWRKLAARLVKIELRKHPEWVATNRPGMTRVWADLTGSLKSAHATVYNAWLGVKAEKLGYVDIERAILETLWNRSRKTLIEWEALAGIEVESRYGEHHDIHNPLVPAHAYLCQDKDGSEYATWRLTNRYIPHGVDIHRHVGQRRKVRAAVNRAVEQSKPAVEMGGGRRRVERTGRLYFTDKQRARRAGQGSKAVIETVRAYKQIDQHLRKHGDVLDRRHYAYLGRRYGVHVLEFSTGTAHRAAISRRDFKAEQSTTFQHRRAQYRIGWADRCL